MAAVTVSVAAPTKSFSSSLAGSHTTFAFWHAASKLKSLVVTASWALAQAEEEPLILVQDQTSSQLILRRDGQMAEKTRDLQNNFPVSVGLENPHRHMVDNPQNFPVPVEQGNLQQHMATNPQCYLVKNMLVSVEQENSQPHMVEHPQNFLVSIGQENPLQHMADNPHNFPVSVGQENPRQYMAENPQARNIVLEMGALGHGGIRINGEREEEKDNTTPEAPLPISDEHKNHIDYARGIFLILIPVLLYVKYNVPKNHGNHSLLRVSNFLGYVIPPLSLISVLLTVFCLRHRSFLKWIKPLNVVNLIIIGFCSLFFYAA